MSQQIEGRPAIDYTVHQSREGGEDALSRFATISQGHDRAFLSTISRYHPTQTNTESESTSAPASQECCLSRCICSMVYWVVFVLTLGLWDLFPRRESTRVQEPPVEGSTGSPMADPSSETLVNRQLPNGATQTPIQQDQARELNTAVETPQGTQIEREGDADRPAVQDSIDRDQSQSTGDSHPVTTQVPPATQDQGLSELQPIGSSIISADTSASVVPQAGHVDLPTASNDSDTVSLSGSVSLPTLENAGANSTATLGKTLDVAEPVAPQGSDNEDALRASQSMPNNSLVASTASDQAPMLTGSQGPDDVAAEPTSLPVSDASASESPLTTGGALEGADDPSSADEETPSDANDNSAPQQGVVMATLSYVVKPLTWAWGVYTGSRE